MDAKPGVAVLLGGPGGEREISLLSGNAVADALEESGYPVLRVEIGEDRRWIVGDAAPRHPEEGVASLRKRVEVVFPALHGELGEDGTMQGFLETSGLAYVGSGVEASAVAMNKELTREIARGRGLAVADGHCDGPCRSASELDRFVAAATDLSLPVFVKPVRAGSSVGVSRVDRAEELRGAIERAFLECDRVLVEQAIEGTEASCPVLGDASRDRRALPVIEIVPHDHAFFDYEAKYTEGVTDEICPGRFDSDLAGEVARAALLMHDALGCRSLSRSDFIIDRDGRPVFLETNTLPGLTPVSLFPKAATAAGMTYSELCSALVEGVLRRRQA